MLRRCLGPVAVTAQAVGTVGLMLTAVFNIPEAMRSAGSASGIAGYVSAGLVAFIAVIRTHLPHSRAAWRRQN